MKRDEERASLESQAENGDLDAQIYLGWAYDRHGVYPYEPDRSEKWLRLAVKQGSLEGLRRLARLKYSLDDGEALLLAKELIDRGDFFGHYLLGHALLHGDCGTPRDSVAGLRELEQAAEMGHLISEYDYLRHSGSRRLNGKLVYLERIRLLLRILMRLTRSPDDLSVYR